MRLDLARPEPRSSPFPHFAAADVIDEGSAAAALTWLRDKADWRLRVEDFYEQHEISLLDQSPAGLAAGLVSPGFVEDVRLAVEEGLSPSGVLQLVGICAHRLTVGQTIRIHNDDVGEEETHRLLIQLNDGWDAERGGLLMLFSDASPESLVDVVMPEHRSAFAFEISPRSHHAVSTIKSGERFTVVYTFRRSGR